MRTLYEHELEEIAKVVERTDYPELEKVLMEYGDIDKTITLRKNISFYFNNYIMLLPRKDPQSFYINLRIDDNLDQLIKGKDTLFLGKIKPFQTLCSV